MKGFQQDLKAIRSNPGNPSAAQVYRPQPGASNLSRPQASQARPQVQSPTAAVTGQTRPSTSPTGQVRPQQQVSSYPPVQVPIPPVPEATPSSSGLVRRGNVAAVPIIREANEKVEVICLDSDDDEDDNVALTRSGGPASFQSGTAVNNPVLLLQSPTHLLSSPQFSGVPLSHQHVDDPLPVPTLTTSGDPLPTASSAAASSIPTPTITTTTDGSSALNLNMSYNNSIPPWFNLLMALTKEQQQELLDVNSCIQKVSQAAYPTSNVTMTTTSDSSQLMKSQLLPEVGVSVENDLRSLQDLNSVREGCLQKQITQAGVGASSCCPLVPVSTSSSAPIFTNSSSPSPSFHHHQTQVLDNTTFPTLSLSSSDCLSVVTSACGPLSSSATVGKTLQAPGQPQNHTDLKHHYPDCFSASNHCPNSLCVNQCSDSFSTGDGCPGVGCPDSFRTSCNGPGSLLTLYHSSDSSDSYLNGGNCSPRSDTMKINKSPSVSPVAQSSPSQFTPSPSSSSLSPLSPYHQPPFHTQTKTPQSSSGPLPSLNISTCDDLSASLKFKRSNSHSTPASHLSPSPAKPLRKTLSSSPPKSYSLDQTFSFNMNEDSPATAGSRSSSMSPTSTLSPSQSNSSDCNSSPERNSKPQNSSPPTRVESSVTFRYSSSPSPSNTPTAPYTPSSIPLLSPVAARLLYLSTGTKLPSSPPEDVDKLPPIINRKKKPVSSSLSTDTQRKEPPSLLKREFDGGNLVSNTPEKKHHIEKKKRRGSSLAKSMELVPTSTDILTDTFFPSAPVVASCVTTPTLTTPPMLSTPLPRMAACITTPSSSSPAPMVCSNLPLRRNSLSSATVASAPPKIQTTTNLWAPNCPPQQPNHLATKSRDQSHAQPLLRSLVKMTSSSSGTVSSSASRIITSSNSVTSLSNKTLSSKLPTSGLGQHVPISVGHTQSSTLSSASAPATLPVWSSTPPKLCPAVQASPSQPDSVASTLNEASLVKEALLKKVSQSGSQDPSWIREALRSQYSHSGSPAVVSITSAQVSNSLSLSSSVTNPVVLNSATLPSSATQLQMNSGTPKAAAVLNVNSLPQSTALLSSDVLQKPTTIANITSQPKAAVKLTKSVNVGLSKATTVTSTASLPLASVLLASGVHPGPQKPNMAMNITNQPKAAAIPASIASQSRASVLLGSSVNAGLPRPAALMNSTCLPRAAVSQTTVSTGLPNATLVQSSHCLAQSAALPHNVNLHQATKTPSSDVPKVTMVTTSVCPPKTNTSLPRATAVVNTANLQAAMLPVSAVVSKTKAVPRMATTSTGVGLPGAVLMQALPVSTENGHQQLQASNGLSLPPVLSVVHSSGVTTNQPVKPGGVPKNTLTSTAFVDKMSTGTLQGHGRSLTYATPFLAASPTYFMSSPPAAHSTSPTHCMSSAPNSTSHPIHTLNSASATLHSTSSTHFTSLAAQLAGTANSKSSSAHLTSPTHFVNVSPKTTCTSHSVSKTLTTTQSANSTHFVISTPAAVPVTSPTHLTSPTATSFSTEMATSSSDSSSGLLSPLPEGLEHRVVSGLLQAGPPMTLNSLLGNNPKTAITTSSGHRVVNTVSAASVNNPPPFSSTVSPTQQRLRRRSSSDSNPLLSPVSAKLTNGFNQPSSKSFPAKAPLSNTKIGSSDLSTSSSVKARSLLPSPITCKAAVPEKEPHPLSSNRKNSGLDLSLNLQTSLESLTVMNGSSLNGLSSATGSQCDGALITSPSDLLSPPGSTTLPDLLKTFTFPASLSPPIERKSKLTSVETSGTASAQQITDRPSQLFLLGQFSLKSLDHQRNGQVQAMNSPIVSPNHQGASPAVVPSSQTNNTMLPSPNLNKDNAVLSPNHQGSSFYVSSSSKQQHRVKSVMIPASQKKGRGLPPLDLRTTLSPNQSRNSPILSPSHQKSASLTGSCVPSSSHQKTSVALPSSFQGIGTIPASDYQRSIVAGSQRRSAFVSADHGRKNGPTLSLELQQGSNVPSSSHQKSGAAFSPNSLRSFSIPASNHPTNSVTQSNTTVLLSNDVVNCSVLPSGCQRNKTVVSHTPQRNNPVPKVDGQRSGAATSPSYRNPPLLSFDLHGKNPMQILAHQSSSSPLVSPLLHSTCTVSPTYSQSSVSLPVANHQRSPVVPGCQGKSTILSFVDLGSKTVLQSDRQRNGNATMSDHQKSSSIPASNQRSSDVISPTFQQKGTMLPLNDLGNGTILPSNQQRNSSVIKHTSHRNSNVLSPDCRRNGTVMSLDHQRSCGLPSSNHQIANPVFSPKSQTSFSMASSCNQRSSTAVSPTFKMSSCQGNSVTFSPTSLRKHNVLPSSGLGNSAFAHPGNCPVVLSDLQGSTLVGSANPCTTTVVSSASPQSSFSAPSYSHQRSSNVASSSSQASPPLMPSHQRNSPHLSTKCKKITRVVVPNPQRNGHDLQPALSAGKQSVPNSRILTPSVERSCLQPTNSHVVSPISQRSCRDLQPVIAGCKQTAPNTPVLPPSGAQRSSCMPSVNCQMRKTGVVQSSFQVNSCNTQSLLPDGMRKVPNTPTLSPNLQRNGVVPSTNIHSSSAMISPSSQRGSSKLSHSDLGSSEPNPVSNSQALQMLNLLGENLATSSCSTPRSSTALSSVQNYTVVASNCQSGSGLPQSTVKRGGTGIPSSVQRNSCRLPSNREGKGPLLTPNHQSGSNIQLSSPLNSRPIPPTLPSYQSALAAKQKATPSLMGVPLEKASTTDINSPTGVAIGCRVNTILNNPSTASQLSNGNLHLRGENVLAQNASLPAVTSPTWDDASLSLLSDIFAPQLPSKQQHRNGSSLPKHSQTSETLPGMGEDQIISELLGSCQNQNFLPANPQSSGTLTNTGGVDIINDLLHVCSAQSQAVSRNDSTKLPAVNVCPKASLDSNIRKSTSTVSPLPLQQVSTPTTVNGSLSQQQHNQSLSSCASFSLPDQPAALSSQVNHVRHLYPGAYSQTLNGAGLSEPNSSTSLNGWENTHPGGSQTLTSSTTQSVHSQPQVGQLSSSQQGATATNLPTLPKLTPLSNQLAPRPASSQPQQTPPIAPPSHCQLPVSTKLQHASQFNGGVAVATTVAHTQGYQLQKSADSALTLIPSSTSDVQLSTTQSSVYLLNTILNSLSESELESLLNPSDNPTQVQPMSHGNGHQVQLPSSSGLIHLQSQTNLNQHFMAPKPTTSTIAANLVPHLSHSPAAAPTKLNTVPHPPRSKVTTTQMSKGTHFRVESSCTSNTAAGLSRHLYQLEPPAATAAACSGVAGMMDGTNIMAYTASVLRLHSGQ